MMDLKGECSVIVLLRGSIRKVFEADVNLSCSYLSLTTKSPACNYPSGDPNISLHHSLSNYFWSANQYASFTLIKYEPFLRDNYMLVKCKSKPYQEGCGVKCEISRSTSFKSHLDGFKSRLFIPVQLRARPAAIPLKKKLILLHIQFRYNYY